MPQRIRTTVGEDPFEFDWDSPNDPTVEDIHRLYTEQHKPKKSLWQKVNTPLLPQIAEGARKVSDAITDPRVNASITNPTYFNPDTFMGKWENAGRSIHTGFRGLLGGAVEGAGNVATQMTSPVDLAATLSGIGAVRRAGKAANNIFKVMSAITAARGGQNIVEGAREGDIAKVGAGGLETTLSLLGARSPVPLKNPVIGQAPKPIVETPPVVKETGTTINPAITRSAVAFQHPVRRPMEPVTPTIPANTGTDGMTGFKPTTKIGASPTPSNIAEPIKKLVTSKDPTIAKAAQEVVQANAVPKPSGVLKGAKRMAEEWLYKPMLSVIKEDSDAGKDIGRMMEKAYADYSTWAGQTSNRLSKATNALTKEELANLPHAINGKAVPLNANVQKAMAEFKAIDNEFMERATKAGLKMRVGDKTVPFAAQDDYWARIYSDNFIKGRSDDIIKDMIAKGMSPDDAAKTLEHSRMFGNRLIDPQHGRKADIEGYRLDVDSQKHHYSDLARRIVEAEQFGNMDTADAASPISKLLAKTNDTTRIRPLVEQYLGRGEKGKGYVHDVANAVNKFQVAVQLPLFAIKNQSQKAMIPIRGNIMEFASALGKYATKEGKDIAENTGALQSIRDIIHEMGGESRISKYYGISKTEEGNRSLASLTGMGSADRLFKQLKANPTHEINRSKLDELLLEDLDTVLKQDTLTPDQRNRAGFRMAELTQGSANPMNLPSKWSEHPETKLITLYKRYALQQSKLIKDSIMQDWKKNLPTALIALSAAGEVVGDTYTGVKSTLQGEDPGKNISERGSDNFVNDMMTKITGDEDAGFLAGRVAADLSDSMALGIIQDFIESGGSRTAGLASFLAGPNVDKVARIGLGVADSARKGSVKPVAKEVAKAVTPVPFNKPVGNLFGEEKKKKRGAIPSF